MDDNDNNNNNNRHNPQHPLPPPPPPQAFSVGSNNCISDLINGSNNPNSSRTLNSHNANNSRASNSYNSNSSTTTSNSKNSSLNSNNATATNSHNLGNKNSFNSRSNSTFGFFFYVLICVFVVRCFREINISLFVFFFAILTKQNRRSNRSLSNQNTMFSKKKCMFFLFFYCGVVGLDSILSHRLFFLSPFFSLFVHLFSGLFFFFAK